MKEILKHYFIPLIVGLVWLVTIILVAIPQTDVNAQALNEVNSIVGVIFGGSAVHAWGTSKKSDDEPKPPASV